MALGTVGKSVRERIGRLRLRRRTSSIPVSGSGEDSRATCSHYARELAGPVIIKFGHQLSH